MTELTTADIIERPHVSVSSIRSFLACRQAWRFSSRTGHNIQSLIPSKHLLLGSAVHEALAAYYTERRLTDKGYDDAVALIRTPMGMFDTVFAQARDRIENSLLGQMPQPIVDYYGLGVSMLNQYMDWAPAHDEFEIIDVETMMTVPVGQFDFVGKADALIKMKMDGSYWILEHKTLPRVPDYRELLFSLQSSAYVWAAHETYGVPIDGVLFNILIKKQIKPPKILKSGKISKDVRQSTTRKLVEAEIKKLGLDRQDYVEFLGKLGKNKYNVRIPVVPTDGMIAYWVRTLRDVGTEMINNPVITPAASRQCARCEFGSLCERIRNGMKWRPVAKYDFVPRDQGDTHAAS